MKTTTRNLTITLILCSFALGWRTTPPTGLVYPINMTLAGERLFVSDLYSGIHVMDVSNLAAPAEEFAIPLYGNRGTAVRDSILYANDNERLLVIRVKDDGYEIVKEIKRRNIYHGWYEGVAFEHDRGFGCSGCGAYEEAALSPMESSGGSGTGSSYATFAVIDNYLYFLDYSEIVTMDISEPENPQEISRIQVGWEVETIYPTNKFLFLGGTRGMYIFNRASDNTIRQIGRLEHVRACDPVVVSGSVAYVTLRGGNACGGISNELLCVDITNPATPAVIGTKPLATPYGLAVQDPYLFVSTGESGFALLSVARPSEPEFVAQFSGWATRDFIWADQTLFVLGQDGLRIFDASNPAAPVLKGAIGPSS